MLLVLCGDTNIRMNHLKTCMRFNIILVIISVIFKYTLFSEVDRVSLQIICLHVKIIQIVCEDFGNTGLRKRLGKKFSLQRQETSIYIYIIQNTQKHNIVFSLNQNAHIDG